MATLHDAIVLVLKEHQSDMTFKAIAEEINKRGLYSRRDGAALLSGQVNARCLEQPRLFELLGNGRVRLL